MTAHGDEIVGLLDQIHALEGRLEQRTFELDAARRTAADLRHDTATVLAHLAHELRTPLNSLVSPLGMLLDDPGASDAPHWLAGAAGAAERLQRVVESLLFYATVASDRLPHSTQPLDVAAAIETTISPFRHMATRRGVLLVADVDPRLARSADLDWPRLAPALTALVDNAVKFSRPGGSVHVRAELDPQDDGDGAERTCTIDVVDNGPGIDPADIERAFEPFTQLDEGTARAHEGMGLGLTIARDLASSVHGEVELRPLPRGLSAHLRFPLTTPT